MLKVSKFKFEHECGMVYRFIAVYQKGIDLLTIINSHEKIMWAEIDGKRYEEKELNENLLLPR